MQARASTNPMNRNTELSGLGAGPSPVLRDGAGVGPADVAITRMGMHTPGQPVQWRPMDILARHAAAQPDKAAVIDGEREWTWREYHARRNRLARALTGLGLAAGEHAALYAHNCA